MSHPSRSMARGLLASVIALGLLPASWAATGSRSDIDGIYQLDRAACLSDTSLHERTSCLREAGAVRAEALRGMRAAPADPEQLTRNALKRCQRLPGADQVLCERRMMGEGVVTGSVAAGGLLRELVVETPATSDPSVAG
jgi:hypothetical protein